MSTATFAAPASVGSTIEPTTATRRPRVSWLACCFSDRRSWARTTTSTNFWQTVPGFSGTSKTLRFYLKISSAEGTGTAYDYLYVRLKNGSGTTVSDPSTR